MTFRQAEGLDPLPRPLKLKELSPELCIDLYRVVEGSIRDSLKVDPVTGDYSPRPHSPWIVIASEVSKSHLYYLLDRMNYFELREHWRSLIEQYKEGPKRDSYAYILEFLQIAVRHHRPDSPLTRALRSIFKQHRASYFIDTSALPVTIMPKSSPAEGEAVQESMKTLREKGQKGAWSHVRKAGQHINQGEWADSIRESIHAVESVVRKESGENSLKRALDRIDGLHPALKKGINELYAYTCDEEGVRHALLDGSQANVGEDTALYMYGACASFASFLVKQQYAPR